jgi:transcription elongation factor Elf1
MSKTKTETRIMTVEEYIAINGVRCPKCRNEHIISSMVDVDAGVASQGNVCNNCGLSWHDEYKLVNMTIDPDSF